jgi:predicted aspartyl protease
MNKIFSRIVGSLAVLAFLAPVVNAEPYYDRGVQMYNARQYKQAAPYLDQACAVSPWDSNAYYYRALCYHQMGDTAHASQYYGQVIKNFPGSTAAGYAATALQKVDPAAYQRVMSGGSARAPLASASSRTFTTTTTTTAAAEDPDLKNAPESSKVYFQNDGGHMVVDATVSNRGMKMIFDTGAEGCFLGTKQLQELGLQAPSGKPTGKNTGVSGTVDSWSVPMKIRVGDLTRTVTVHVAEGEQMPLLGQNFFKDFDYDIDKNASCINFHKKHATAGGARPYGQAPDAYAVSFQKGGGAGNEMLVTAEVKGRKCRMFFDTGAQTTLFIKKDLAAMHIEVPDDAEETRVRGVGGESKAIKMYVDELRMGPIIRKNFQITVMETGDGLIGQDFVGEWRYKVDNGAKQIKFFH